ncbi:hypothetical protein [Demequina litorisediminis]|uniref:hypothetical protein n=1 Tax=Demequina litorisediminis TaxID=1849022 RepID=UPI0024E11E94|nr:hypothetical protein [Demequina litorisediminis]
MWGLFVLLTACGALLYLVLGWRSGVGLWEFARSPEPAALFAWARAVAVLLAVALLYVVARFVWAQRPLAARAPDHASAGFDLRRAIDEAPSVLRQAAAGLAVGALVTLVAWWVDTGADSRVAPTWSDPAAGWGLLGWVALAAVLVAVAWHVAWTWIKAAVVVAAGLGLVGLHEPTRCGGRAAGGHHRARRRRLWPRRGRGHLVHRRRGHHGIAGALGGRGVVRAACLRLAPRPPLRGGAVGPHQLLAPHVSPVGSSRLQRARRACTRTARADPAARPGVAHRDRVRPLPGSGDRVRGHEPAAGRPRPPARASEVPHLWAGSSTATTGCSSPTCSTPTSTRASAVDYRADGSRCTERPTPWVTPCGLSASFRVAQATSCRT